MLVIRETGNPYGHRGSLAPRGPRPGPAPVVRADLPRDRALDQAEAARQRLALCMRRASYPHEFD